MYLKTWILICEFIMAIVFIVEVILVSDKERDEDVYLYYYEENEMKNSKILYWYNW